MSRIPTLMGTMYLDDIDQKITYTIRRYMRTPANTLNLFGSALISLTDRVAVNWMDPATLCSLIRADLTSVYRRIIDASYNLSVLTDYALDADTGRCDVTITVSYVRQSGDKAQMAVGIYVDGKGKLVLPQDTLTQ